MPEGLNLVQEVLLFLMEQQVNSNIPNLASLDLRAAPHLWRAVLFTREDRLDLLLRGIAADEWIADTLFILSSGINDDQLLWLAQGWHADRVEWTTLAALGAGNTDEDCAERVLRVRWEWDEGGLDV